MNKITRIERSHRSEGDDGSAAGFDKGLYVARRPRRCARAVPRDRADRQRASRRSASTIRPGPIPIAAAAIDVERGLPRIRDAWVKRARRRRSLRRPRDQARGQRQCVGIACGARLSECAAARPRHRRRAHHPIRICPRRNHHEGDGLRRASREPRPQRPRWRAPRKR